MIFKEYQQKPNKLLKSFILRYTNIYLHLNRNKSETGIRYEWYALQRWGANYGDDFSKQKIVWGNLCLSAQFSWVEDDYFINAPSPMIISGNKYLLGALNSKISDWYIRQLGVTRNGGYFEYKPMFVELTPIPKIDLNLQRKIENLVDKIIKNKLLHKETLIIENEIDSIMYQIYDLSNDEITAISSSLNE